MSYACGTDARTPPGRGFLKQLKAAGSGAAAERSRAGLAGEKPLRGNLRFVRGAWLRLFGCRPLSSGREIPLRLSPGQNRTDEVFRAAVLLAVWPIWQVNAAKKAEIGC
jgi:hypothetical protein